MQRLEGAPRGTVAVTKKIGRQVRRVSRVGWERCSCPAITAETGVTAAKWWAPSALPAGSAREMGVETAGGPTVKKKKCTGSPFLSPPPFIQNRGPISVLKSITVFYSRHNRYKMSFPRLCQFALNQVLVHLPDSLRLL